MDSETETESDPSSSWIWILLFFFIIGIVIIFSMPSSETGINVLSTMKQNQISAISDV